MTKRPWYCGGSGSGDLHGLAGPNDDFDGPNGDLAGQNGDLAGPNGDLDGQNGDPDGLNSIRAGDLADLDDGMFSNGLNQLS